MELPFIRDTPPLMLALTDAPLMLAVMEPPLYWLLVMPTLASLGPALDSVAWLTAWLPKAEATMRLLLAVFMPLKPPWLSRLTFASLIEALTPAVLRWLLSTAKSASMVALLPVASVPEPLTRVPAVTPMAFSALLALAVASMALPLTLKRPSVVAPVLLSSMLGFWIDADSEPPVTSCRLATAPLVPSEVPAPMVSTLLASLPSTLARMALSLSATLPLASSVVTEMTGLASPPPTLETREDSISERL